jgi:hypothetical protein
VHDRVDFAPGKGGDRAGAAFRSRTDLIATISWLKRLRALKTQPNPSEPILEMIS